MTGGFAATVRAAIVSPWTVALTAVVLRLVYLAQYSTDPTFTVPLWDAEDYHRLAESLAELRLPADLNYRPPLYPMFLGLVYLLFGTGFLLPRLIQLLAGVATALLARSIAGRLFGPGTGFIAGIVTAGSGMMIYFDLELLPTGMETLALMLMLDALLRPEHRRAGVRSGLCFAAASLLRPTFLPLFPLGLVWLWRRGGRRAVAAFSLTALAPLIVSLGLHLAAGEGWVLVSAQGGVNLYIGNHRSSDGMTAHLPGVGPGWSWETLQGIAEADRGRALTASQVDGYFLKLGLKEIAADPGSWAARMGRKAGLFFSRLEISNNRDLYYHASKHRVMGRLLWLGFPLLLPLALVGFVLHRRSESVKLIGIAALILFCVVVLFFINSRFRHPLTPLTAVMAAGGIVGVAALFRTPAERKPARILSAAAAAAVGVLVTFSADTGINPRRHDYGLFTEAMALEKLGRLEEAREFYLKSLAANPAAPYANFAIAELDRAAGGWRSAAEHYRRELEINPTYAKAWNNLGVTLVEIGDEPGAAEAFRRALSLQPWMEEARRNAARVHGRLGMAAMQGQDWISAQENLEQAVQLEPTNPLFATLRLQCRFECGDTTGLRGQVEEILRRWPGFEPAQLLQQDLLNGL